jgi:hypothetical protein
VSPLEALEAVGLASLDGVTADSLRRAYLRKLREHPPEGDPDGFAHLRAAFEMVRQQIELRDHLAAGRARLVVVPAGPTRPRQGRVIAVPVAPAAPPPAPAARLDPPVAPIDPPAAPPIAPAPAPPMRLGELVPALISRLLAGEADEAVALEAAWRADGGDDCRVIAPAEAARWLFVRELVGVARELPEGVRHPLTLAVREGDFRGARAVLEDFGRRNREAALVADGVLQREAPMIYAHVRGCLVPLQVPVKPRSPMIRRSDAWPIIRVIVGVVVVLVAVTSQQGGHSPRPPDLQTPIPPEVQTAMQTASDAFASSPAPASAAAEPSTQPASSVPEVPAPSTPGADPHIADAEAQCRLIEDHAHPASSAQRAAAAAMRGAIHHSCNAKRMALHDLEHAAPLPDRDERPMSAGAIRLIEADVDALCPESAPPR